MANEKKMNYVILGLLSHDSMTGYQIKKRMDTVLKFFWGASFGSIYPTLNGLVKEDMVTKFETRENGRRQIIYTITDTGAEALKDWLRLPVEKDEVRYETLLKLFFGDKIGEEGSILHILSFEEKIKGDLAILRMVSKELEGILDLDRSHQYQKLTADFGIKTYEAYLEWCKEAKEILK